MSAACVLPTVWATAVAPERVEQRSRLRPVDGLAFYRRHTEALLRRYMQLSMLMGRTPSLLGNSVFRGRVSSYRLHSFEDCIIFLFDVEKCLKKLDCEAKSLIATIALQEYTQAEAADRTGQSLRSVERKYGAALDRVTASFLETELLQPEVDYRYVECRQKGAEARGKKLPQKVGG